MPLEINATTARINGETFAVSKKPKYKRGVAKITSNPSLIGDTVVVTHSKDFTEAMGEVTLSFRHTPYHIQAAESWQDKEGNNAVMLIDVGTGWTKTFNQMSVEEDIEHDFDSGEFEVVFKGGQGV